MRYSVASSNFFFLRHRSISATSFSADQSAGSGEADAVIGESCCRRQANFFGLKKGGVNSRRSGADVCVTKNRKKFVFFPGHEICPKWKFGEWIFFAPITGPRCCDPGVPSAEERQRGDRSRGCIHARKTELFQAAHRHAGPRSGNAVTECHAVFVRLDFLDLLRRLRKRQVYCAGQGIGSELVGAADVQNQGSGCNQFASLFGTQSPAEFLTKSLRDDGEEENPDPTGHVHGEIGEM